MNFQFFLLVLIFIYLLILLDTATPQYHDIIFFENFNSFRDPVLHELPNPKTSSFVAGFLDEICDEKEEFPIIELCLSTRRSCDGFIVSA